MSFYVYLSLSLGYLSLLRVFLAVFISLIYMSFIVLILFLASSFSLSLCTWRFFALFVIRRRISKGMLKKSLECIFQLWMKFYYYSCLWWHWLYKVTSSLILCLNTIYSMRLKMIGFMFPTLWFKKALSTPFKNISLSSPCKISGHGSSKPSAFPGPRHHGLQEKDIHSGW